MTASGVLSLGRAPGSWRTSLSQQTREVASDGKVHDNEAERINEGGGRGKDEKPQERHPYSGGSSDPSRLRGAARFSVSRCPSRQMRCRGRRKATTLNQKACQRGFCLADDGTKRWFVAISVAVVILLVAAFVRRDHRRLSSRSTDRVACTDYGVTMSQGSTFTNESTSFETLSTTSRFTTITNYSAAAGHTTADTAGPRAEHGTAEVLVTSSCTFME